MGNKYAESLTRYLLFTDEVPLPEGGIEGDQSLKEYFLKNARKSAQGNSLREFDLRTRLFKYRCSYMVHSAAFEGLPPPLKERIILRLKIALDVSRKSPVSLHLPDSEKQSIHRILNSTLKPYSQTK